MKPRLLPFSLLSFCVLAFSQAQLAPDVAPFVSVTVPVFAIEHVRVIDGTGAPERVDQTVVIANGKIQATGASASASVPAGATHIDGHGATLLPGLVGMHDHLYYTASASDQLDANGKLEEPGLFI